MGEPTQGGGHRIEPGSLREPFPLSEPWIWEGSAFPDTASIERVHRFGTLPLGTDGDGMDYVLVVTGDARGQVWMITGEGAVPVASDFGKWLAGDVFPEATWTLDARIRTGHPRP